MSHPREFCVTSRIVTLSQEVELDESVNRNPLQRKNVIQLTNCLEMFTSKEQLGRQDPWSVALHVVTCYTVKFWCLRKLYKGRVHGKLTVNTIHTRPLVIPDIISM